MPSPSDGDAGWNILNGHVRPLEPIRRVGGEIERRRLRAYAHGVRKHMLEVPSRFLLIKRGFWPRVSPSFSILSNADSEQIPSNKHHSKNLFRFPISTEPANNTNMTGPLVDLQWVSVDPVWDSGMFYIVVGNVCAFPSSIPNTFPTR